MRIFVNNQEVELLPGMTVRHALIGAGLHKTLAEGTLVTDEWGNPVGLEGELIEGARIIVGTEDEVTCAED